MSWLPLASCFALARTKKKNTSLGVSIEKFMAIFWFSLAGYAYAIGRAFLTTKHS